MISAFEFQTKIRGLEVTWEPFGNNEEKATTYCIKINYKAPFLNKVLVGHKMLGLKRKSCMFHNGGGGGGGGGDLVTQVE